MLTLYISLRYSLCNLICVNIRLNSVFHGVKMLCSGRFSHKNQENVSQQTQQDISQLYIRNRIFCQHENNWKLS